ncbi:16S rRNA (guanine(527)-N(7))-methyltransferase RsmG [Sulfitobacter sp. SK012]|uniref:16S rRNA (guanine(527)-N(7))-methyltransferase RsmG n=1 Tax=Sulfitobacter sp. SK012 TaxID=1389005 RepID=UPI000E0B20BD|nr:16S rRNA (guanine(527)-N(7))-methyltransferase RsmG [Sulfitobacter sp. SK012]AXI44624.1 16S rRNA (guanine(527)-N(7))-methyltransferase RsmG [Sulfitobacter sp. SK012]
MEFNPELLDVSRETFDRLNAFVDLVRKWNPKINLVSSSSLDHIWDRHIADSAQLYDLAPSGADWLDIGSGGGFPGVVAAIMDVESNDRRKFTFIESDQRKCAFLRTAAREMGLTVEVISERIEEAPPVDAPVVSARALGSLNELLGHAERHMAEGGTALFPKGKSWREESDVARLAWSYEAEEITSKTNPEAVILRIRGIKRV